jgi:hypothetical protein
MSARKAILFDCALAVDVRRSAVSAEIAPMERVERDIRDLLMVDGCDGFGESSS